MRPYRKGVTVSTQNHPGIAEGIHHPWQNETETGAVSRREGQRGRKAAPLARSRHDGNRTRVTVTLQLASGGAGWVVVTSAQGRSMAPLDETLWSLMQRVQKGHLRLL